MTEPDIDLVAYVEELLGRRERERVTAEKKQHEADTIAGSRWLLERQLGPELEKLTQKTPSTRTIYAQDCKRFARFCAEIKMPTLPAAPEIVALFLRDEANKGASVSVITRLVAAIGYAHRLKKAYDVSGDLYVRAMVARIKKEEKEKKESKSTASAQPQDAPKVVISGSTAAIEGGEIELQQ